MTDATDVTDGTLGGAWDIIDEAASEPAKLGLQKKMKQTDRKNKLMR